MTTITVPTNTSAPLCPYCTRPVTGPHHVDEGGQAWHLSCAEGQGLMDDKRQQRAPGQFGLGLPRPQVSEKE